MPGEEIIGQMGAPMLKDAFNIWKDGMFNKAQQKWAIAMYNRQRADALADWNRENEYNSPSGQMARLKAAGLNPNLVYGHGAVATGGDIRSSSAPNVNIKGSDASGPDTNAVMGFHDIELKEAQLDNLRTINTVNMNEAALKETQRQGVELDNRKKEFDYGFETETRPEQVESRRAGVKKLQAETKTMLDRNEREALANAQSLRKGVEEILTMRLQRAKTQEEINHIKKQIELISTDITIKNFDIKLLEKGLRPGDNIIFRAGSQIIDKLDKMKPGDLIPDYKGKSLFTIDLDSIFN